MSVHFPGAISLPHIWFCPAELDGKQVLDFYWADPIDAMKIMVTMVAKLQYKDKLYTTFKPGESILVPGDRAFDQANSGMVFQGSYLIDTGSSPLFALFYADASFAGQSMSHHPIYSKLLCAFVIIMHGIRNTDIIFLCVYSICMKMGATNPATGFQSVGCLCTTKAETKVLVKASSPPRLERFDCTISVG